MTDTDQTDFPILIKITDITDAANPVFDNAQSNGDDILFTLSDGITKLNHEIEKYDSSTGNEELIAWVKIPVLSSSTGTNIYIYYGNSSALNQENAQGVWDSNYKGVWHLKEEQAGTGTLGLYQDSTINNNNGDDHVSAVGQEGQINSGQEFDGTDDYIDAGNNTSLDITDTITISAWVNLRSTSGPRGIVIKGAAKYALYFPSDSAVPRALLDGLSPTKTLSFGSAINLNEWTHLSFTYDMNGGTDNLKTYINGNLSSTDTKTGAILTDTLDLMIGSYNGSGVFFNGFIDEVRISSAARSADWIKASYNNQNNPGVYLGFGAEETSTPPPPADWYNTDWLYRQQITISSTMTDTDQTEFPVLIQITDSANPVFDNALSNGDDILFTSSDGIQLAHEIEKYDNSTGNEELIAWVKIPTLSSSTDTNIYMYYGNTAASNQENPQGVWDSNYKGVWHLKEEQAGTGNLDLYQDSTTNNNGDDYVSADGQEGQINSGQEFDGADDYIDITQIISFTDFTGEAWVNVRDDGTFRGIFVADRSTHLKGFKFAVKPDGKAWFLMGGDGTYTILNTDAGIVSNDIWHHIAVVGKSGSYMKIYVDGVEKASMVTTQTVTPPTDRPYIGTTYTSTIEQINGFIDEFRISSTARSAEWIKASYNNQSSPGTYLNIGLQETPTGTIKLNATLDGVDWTGSVDYTLSGPENINGTSTPATFSGEPVGEYTLAYTSGGPSDAALSDISPSGTQTLAEANGTITFTMNFISLPAAPSNLTATTISTSQIDLTWTNNSDNETGFKIDRKTGVGGTYSQIATLGADVISYSDTGLTPDTTYSYRVKAYNIGDSGYSNEANTTTLPLPPDAPSLLGATAISSSRIDLSWTDNSNNETGFKIERKIGTGGTYSQIATVSVNVTTYSDTGLTAETTYYYQVKAYNAGGESGYSNEANATTMIAIPPTATTDPATNLNGNAATLNATVNPSGSETTVYFEWGTSTSYGNSTTPQSIGSGIDDVIVSADITGLSPNTTYHYRVIATNAAGTVYGLDASFTTPPITLTITYPSDGSTIYRPDTIVTGTVTNLTGNETGVVINGIVATVMSLSNYNGEFFANHVPLEEGQNTITATATDTESNTATTSITVNAETTTPHVTLRANIESGIAPLETYFSVSTSIPNSVSTYEMDYEGDGIIDYTGATFEDISFTYTTEGIYYPTVTVTDTQSITYSDTIAIVVLSETELDALLRATWEAMKTAMENQNVEGAITQFISTSQERYQNMFNFYYDSLPNIVSNMQDIEKISIENGVAEYRIKKTEAVGEVTYYIYFILDENGIWKIQQF